MTTHALMTETLPAVVGMGVASRTTEHMFGRRGGVRKAKTVGACSGNSRKFDGKVYRAANWHTTKAIAERDAKYFRRAGHSARIVKSYNARLKRWGYIVYVR